METFTNKQISTIENLCEIAYCCGLYKIDSFDGMEEALQFYSFVNDEFIKALEYKSLYDFIQEENLKKLYNTRISILD